MADAAELNRAWKLADEAGIRCLRIPTPFQVGRVNCWLIEDEPLTLIDTGPNSGKALDELDRQLRAIGHRLDAIERVIITHQHIDHMGLADIIKGRSGAAVAALDLLVGFLGSYGTRVDEDDDFAGRLMHRYGISDDIIVALRSVSQSFRSWGGRVDVTEPLADGDVLEMGNRRLEVIHRPGHSPSDTVFWDAERRILIGADHLIAHISSNPLMTKPLDGSDQRPRSLVSYLDSLARTREMPIDVVLPGHGEPITDHVSLIDSRFEMHRRRAEKIYGLIDQAPRTAFEIARELWGNVAVTQAFLTLSEVVGHVDLLIADGRVDEIDADGVVHFAAAG